MSDLIEDIVGEWLCLKGYFIIRGLKVGLNEIDVLAIRPSQGKVVEAAHYEVQVSTRPVGYIGDPNAKRKTDDEIRESVTGWVKKRYTNPKIVELIQRLVGSRYDRYFVTGNRKHKMELVALRSHGVRIIRFPRVLAELRDLRRKGRGHSGKPPEFLETADAQRCYQLLEMARADRIRYMQQ